MRCRILILAVLIAFLSVACGRGNYCKISIGTTGFHVEPNSAQYPGLNNVGGYQYLTGGHLGVVIVRTAYNDFVCYERTCPCNDSSQVAVSPIWGSAILECPNCHSLFSVYNDGMPMDGSATTCNLFQYSTTFDGTKLYVY